MAAGKPVLVTRAGRVRIDAAVKKAEEQTRLQFCVYLGPADDDTRAHAEALFEKAGMHERPAVLLLVAPEQRRVEIVTAPDVRERLTDEECANSIAEMTQHFASGDFVDGIVTGLRELAERTGPGTSTAGTIDLPNVIGEEEES